MAQNETSFEGAEPQSTEDYIVSDDRRRPERPDHVNPTLIPLLGIALAPGLPPKTNADLAHDYEELAPADAIAAIVLLSTLLLGVVGFVGWTIIN